MDEPLSNLDAKLRLEMRAEIRRIHSELGRSTIYVTHDQDEALSLADRIVVLHEGDVQQIGSPEELYARPANLEVARFMGYRNILDLDAERVDGERGRRCAAPGSRSRGTAQQRDRPGPVTVALRPDDRRAGRRRRRTRSRPASRSSNIAAATGCVDLVTATGSDALRAQPADSVAPGDAVRCTVAPERVLVYPGRESGG